MEQKTEMKTCYGCKEAFEWPKSGAWMAGMVGEDGTTSGQIYWCSGDCLDKSTGLKPSRR